MFCIGKALPGFMSASSPASTAIVLDTFNRTPNTELEALEVDHTVAPLVAATDVVRRYAAIIVAPAALGQSFGKALDGAALPQTSAVDEDQTAAGRRCRFIFSQRHR
jgi:hypothetical protein